MQKMVVASLVLPYVWVSLSYILAWCGNQNTLEQLSVAVVSVPIATVVAYAIQNCFRAKWFKDKTADQPIQPYQPYDNQNVNTESTEVHNNRGV